MNPQGFHAQMGRLTAGTSMSIESYFIQQKIIQLHAPDRIRTQETKL